MALMMSLPAMALMMSLALLLTGAGAQGALTAQELAAGQPSFLFILVRQCRCCQYSTASVPRVF